MIQARRGEILSLAQQNGEVLASELSKLLGVSEVTVRSDLKALAEAGQLRRTRGGARLLLDLHRESPLEETSQKYSAAKRRIGRAAAALVQDGETVFLDVGSTTTEVARALSPTLREVTVITNGLNIALELERLPNLRVIVTGGTLRPLQHSLVSPYALEILRHIHADRLFLGCNGVSTEAGVTNANHEEAEIKRAMVQQSREIVVVADHSKLGQISRAQVAPMSAVHTLITDRQGDASPPPDLTHLIAHIQLV
ncbi:DeoR/GlpR family DNA-binding transcription regulator [Deinococcus arenicola]|uniref:DeoR/GlpR family DNA-binding transcription regulator n=1 Tax=Deinococcus arenicola TaxID=2994950 RepID=A0ABU4DQE3_9DEIO|nr:DeoR/GlpR family DNA-binding transcription regulator [Deinococcus sp. ZS9-10]MDV6374657.1 DeoR/GlpR family DNA-binding transcription regulator [Deinococcus sp. ZS9-10]